VIAPSSGRQTIYQSNTARAKIDIKAAIEEGNE
jgi:hypothetical protein